MVQMLAIQVDDTHPLPKTFWITLSVLNCILVLYALVHFSIFVDGYYRTCYQYRKTLENLLGVHGSAVPVIYNRLSCQSIFDFMDYMQPNSAYGFRDGTIYTGIDLILGIAASFLAWILFGLSGYINIKMARKSD